MSTQSGRATIFGFSGFDGTGISYTGIGNLFPQNFDINDEFKLDELRDQDNEVQSFIASGRIYVAKLNFVPVADSGTNTIVNARLSLEPPAPLARVTLTNFPWAGANSATWVYSGGWRLAFTKDGVATYELEIRKSPDRDLSVPIT